MPKKLTIEDAHSAAKEHGGKCLSEVYIGSNEKMLWECEKGHQWYDRLNNVRCGRWCSGCKKKDINTIRETLLEHNKVLLEEVYISGHTLMKMQCIKCSNIFKTRYYDAIKYNCPKCATEVIKSKLKLSIDNVRLVIENKNGILLSENYDNARRKLDVKCNVCNNIWHPTYDKIKQGKWCPKCCGNIKLTFGEVKCAIEDLGYTLISDNYFNNQTKLNLLCREGHPWAVTYGNVMGGKGCPKCGKLKTQKIIEKIIKEIFPTHEIKFNYKGIKEFVGKSGRKLELDIYVPTLRLAIEYDGEQHFQPVNFGGISDKEAEKKFKMTQHLDKIKNKLIEEHPEIVKYFIRISYMEKKQINRDYIIEKLIKVGLMEVK